MESQLGAERKRDGGAKARAVSSADPQSSFVPSALDEESLRVYECLAESGAGMTVGQLEARLSCSPGSLQQALDTLVQRRLVARLNTVIPSYCCRPSSSGVHAG